MDPELIQQMFAAAEALDTGDATWFRVVLWKCRSGVQAVVWPMRLTPAELKAVQSDDDED